MIFIPVLLSAVGATTNGKQTAFAYLTSNVLGTILTAAVFYILNGFLHFSFTQKTMSMVSIAALNSFYRLVVVLVLFPFRNQIECISAQLFKPSEKKNGKAVELVTLENRFTDHPALALEQCRDAVNDMAEKTKEALFLACGLLRQYNQEDYDYVQVLENSADQYEDKLSSYLLKVTIKELTEGQSEVAGKFLHTITDFERISDHAVNLAEAAKEIHEKGVVFSDAAACELQTIEAAITEIVTITVTAFLSNDLQLAAKVEPLDELIDNLCGELKLYHVQRLKSNVCSLNAGFVFNDILNNYERIADHCSNVAVAMIALESDSFDTHAYLDSVRKLKNEAYAKYFSEFSQKYSIE